jgi:hypothetical protein
MVVLCLICKQEENKMKSVNLLMLAMQFANNSEFQALEVRATLLPDHDLALQPAWIIKGSLDNGAIDIMDRFTDMYQVIGVDSLGRFEVQSSCEPKEFSLRFQSAWDSATEIMRNEMGAWERVC